LATLSAAGGRLAAAVFLLTADAAVAPKVESIGAPTEPTASEVLRSALESKGVRLSLDGRPFCELWLRKTIPAEKSAAPGALYPDLAVSTAVGAIRFASAATDFRGQSIPPGLYTLRYALPPEDGSHLGVSDYPDFLLLVRASDDPNPTAKKKLEDLLESSRRATGTKHPGVLSLTKPSGANFPEASVNERAHLVLQVRAKLDSGADMPIALVVRGHAEQ
jgi:hypothetical protein